MDKAIVYERKDKDIPEYVGEFNSPSRKQREAYLMQQIGNSTVKESLWDSDWLKNKYPARFKGQYLREALKEDIYDAALYIDTTNDENI